MPDGREVADSELLDVAKDEERARSLRRALRTLSTGPDPKLREMANGVLRGQLSPQQVFTDPEYTAALFAGAAEVRRAGERRSEAEVREAGERFEAWQEGRRTEEERDDIDTGTDTDGSAGGGGGGGDSRTNSGQSGGPWGQSGLGGGARPEGRFGNR